MSVHLSGDTVLERRSAEEVFLYDSVCEIFAPSSANASSFLREVESIPPNDALDYIPMDIFHTGVGGNVGTPFDGDTWGL